MKNLNRRRADKNYNRSLKVAAWSVFLGVSLFTMAEMSPKIPTIMRTEALEYKVRFKQRTRTGFIVHFFDKDTGKLLGALTYKDGKAEFSGDSQRSAQRFLTDIVYQYDKRCVAHP